MGRHAIYVLPTLSKLLKYDVFAEFSVALGTGFVKMSVCIFILRLIKGTHRRIAISLYVIIILNSLITLTAVFLIAFQCTPFRKSWNPFIPGRCFSAEILTAITRVVGGILPFRPRGPTVNIVLVAFGCLTDFMCAIIPFFVLRQLQMDRKIKSALIIIMSLALL